MHFGLKQGGSANGAAKPVEMRKERRQMSKRVIVGAAESATQSPKMRNAHAKMHVVECVLMHNENVTKTSFVKASA